MPNSDLFDDASVTPAKARRPVYRHPALVTLYVLIVVLALFLALFDWNWLRAPLERYVTSKTQREFRISDLKVRLGLTPVITMRDVYIANAPWSDVEPMADVKTLRFSVSLRDLWQGRVLIPEVDVADGQTLLERTADGRKNWLFSDPNDHSPSRLKISALHAERFTLRYRDPAARLDVRATANDISAPGKLASSDAKFTTRIGFQGTYKDAPFGGEALTANLITFEESDKPFPLIAHIDAGKTSVDLNGTISDVVELKAIDADLRIKGSTLANIYPYLLLPLPASPPYEIDGRLDFRGSQYRYGEFHGHIGETDLKGDASYTSKEPRPLLQIKIASKLLNMADLGPLIGVETQSGSGKPAPSAALGTRETARGAVHATNANKANPVNNDRILPSGKINPEKLRVIDAKVSLVADRLKAGVDLPLDSMSVNLDLQDGVLKLDPVDIGFAQGHIIGHIELNGQQQPIAARADIEARGLSLEKILPKSQRISPSEGRLAASIKISGRGDSISDVLAKGNGDMRTVVSGGQISNLADAAVGLNGGKVLRLLATGDQDIPLRCAVVDVAVAGGIGHTRSFLIDTEQTEIKGEGSVNFADEYFDFTLHPEPKHPDILSLRSPIHVFGPFTHPDYSIDKTALAERAGATILLGVLNPLAALLPLLETGPGNNADCQALLASNRIADTRGPTMTGKAAPSPAAPVVPPAKK